MTLSTQQVQRISELVKQHIPYYDLQVEMVDHLASNIEERLEESNSVSFEQALQIAYATFGSSGFKLLIRKRRNSLQKQKWQSWFQSLVKNFISVRLFYVLIIFAVAYVSTSLWGNELNQVVMLLTLAAYFITSFCVEYIVGKTTRYQLLLTETFRASVLGFIFPQMIFWIAVGPFINNPVGFATAVTGFVLMANATISVNKNSVQKARQLYPESFIKA